MSPPQTYLPFLGQRFSFSLYVQLQRVVYDVLPTAPLAIRPHCSEFHSFTSHEMKSSPIITRRSSTSCHRSSPESLIIVFYFLLPSRWGQLTNLAHCTLYHPSFLVEEPSLRLSSSMQSGSDAILRV